MSDNEVYVAYGDDASKTATLLLAAAEESKDHDQGQVRSVEGGFYAPKAVADKAGVDYESEDDDDGSPSEPDEKKATAKKAAPAKK